MWDGERVRTSVHCHCLQHFSLVWFHLGWEGCCFYLGVFFVGGWEVIEYQHNVSFPFNAVIDVASFFFLFLFYFFKLIRPHAHAVEILCGQHLMMNVYDFLSCCSFKHTHEAECQIPSSIFLSFIPRSSKKKKKKKSPLWHVARPLTPSFLSLPLLLLMKSIGNALLIMKALSTHQWSLI